MSRPHMDVPTDSETSSSGHGAGLQAAGGEEHPRVKLQTIHGSSKPIVTITSKRTSAMQDADRHSAEGDGTVVELSSPSSRNTTPAVLPSPSVSVAARVEEFDTFDEPALPQLCVANFFRSHWLDMAVTIAIGILGLILDAGDPYYGRVFFERDPTLSYPLVKQDIPNSMLIVYTLIIPPILIILTHILWAAAPNCYAVRVRRVGKSTCMDWFTASGSAVPRVFTERGALYLGWAQTLVLNLSVTGFYKLMFGRLRPNFFALCNYKGYADAWATGNFTAYYAATSPGVVGDLSKCLNDVADAHMSYPSGHTSTSYASWTFLGLMWGHLLFDAYKQRVHGKLTLAIIASSPMFAALTVGMTRTKNYYHNFDDVMSGGAIGFVIAIGVYAMHFIIPPPRKEKVSDCACVSGDCV